MVSGSPSVSEGEQQNNDTVPPFFTYSEKFYEAFPYYLSIGMSSEQYWEGDHWLVKYYKKADQLKKERRNEELWLQGMYIYEALCDVSPVLNSFAKKGTKPRPYSALPYPISNKQQKKTAEDKERRQALKAKSIMSAFMQKSNERFEKKKDTKDTQTEGG